MEVQFDGTSGEATLTRGLAGAIPQQQQSNSPETLSESPEELESVRVANAAKGLGNRLRQQDFMGGVTDEDYDNGSFNASLADLELQLQEAQHKQLHASSPLEKARFASEAERLANLLVTGNIANPQDHKITKKEDGTVKEELEGKGIDVQAALNNAGDVLSDDSLTAWNTLLQSKNRDEQAVGTQMLNKLRKTPEQFNTNIQDHQVINDALAQDISKEFGDDVAHALQTLSLSVANGICTPAEAIRLNMNNDKLAKATKTLLQRGTIRLTV